MRIRLTEAILSLLILLLVYTPPLLSQEGRGSFADTTVAFVRAVEAINGLHKGALIVTIPTESKKIKELDRLLAGEKLKEKTRAHLEKRRERIISSVDSMRLALTNLFTTYYNYSALYFLPDTALATFVSGEREGIFMDYRGMPEVSIKMEELYYVISRIGRTSLSESTGVQALIFQDMESRDLAPPFPYFIRLFSLKKQILGSFDNEANVSKSDLAPRIMQWCDRLTAFKEAIE